MRYQLTPDLLTGNALIDTEHRQLFDAINNLMDDCESGKGRASIVKTTDFLLNYVAKHFSDEERLQVSSKYPAYPTHKNFHEAVSYTHLDVYKRQEKGIPRSTGYLSHN